MANSSGTPLPVSVLQARGMFTGLDKYLDRVAANSGASTIDYLRNQIRKAQGDLEDLTQRPFFVTKFCTEELANQLVWVQGVDYDEIIQPLDYNVDQWRMATGRTELPKRPIVTQSNTAGLLEPVQYFRLSLGQGGQIADVPPAWCQADAKQGVLHLMPQALTDLGIQYFTLFAMHPAAYKPGLANNVPLFVHVAYYAGLCERLARDGESPFDPEEYPLPTRWNQAEVKSYQDMILKQMAATVYPRVAPALNRGGVSLSIDGIGRSVNSNSLGELAGQLRTEVMEWAEGRGRAQGGSGWVFVGR